VTGNWKKYTQERVDEFDRNKDALVQIHRQDTYNRLRYFYNVVRELYADGNLGGGKFIARKPLKA